MPLPKFNAAGDLPPGVYRATLSEVAERFGSTVGQRAFCAQRLLHIHALAQRTGHLQSLVLFGSFITSKPEPNDVDIVLVMDDAFRLEDCPVEARGLFDHALAQARHGASIFWIRPALLLGESLDDFISYWQIKRDGSKRGIVEVR
jgi:hypothetical protein